ncbi:hypothetical protein DDZ14_01865 [Maritimibacter sp. 55A14]|uniref:hypothetical protein n=1 Tax=Maritimibacter sp. 55A14 TaxID=2174844 RepID=UPI000D621524|nr:hypothetical protein [Maritimibacter sp. 55A14]PWE33937.1 hypothetical protein DDZ14_01865 [Maritimibacter sp. 55A14]
MGALIHIRAGLALVLAGGLSACASGEGAQADRAAASPQYLGAEARLLDSDLINIRLSMRGARDRAEVAEYGKCATAGHALNRGYGFARHLRTNVEEDGGLWRGDAVYTVSADRPRGLRIIDAREAVADCAQKGIPTV